MGTRARFICAAQRDWIADLAAGIPLSHSHGDVIARINRNNVAPDLLRALILTARTPHAVLGVTPYATPEQIRIGHYTMITAAKRLKMDSPIVLDTIERAANTLLERINSAA